LQPIVGHWRRQGTDGITNQAFWTAAYDSIPVVYVIFNDAQYRILKQRTLALKGFAAEDDRYIAMDLVNPTSTMSVWRSRSACRASWWKKPPRSVPR
jgi:hypothetical protein